MRHLDETNEQFFTNEQLFAVNCHTCSRGKRKTFISNQKKWFEFSGKIKKVNYFL